MDTPAQPTNDPNPILPLLDWFGSAFFAVRRAAFYLFSLMTDPILDFFAGVGTKVSPTTLYILVAAIAVLLTVVFGKRFPVAVVVVVLGTAVWQSLAS